MSTALINVQFSDASEKSIVAYFADQQDESLYPNQGQIDSSDARYATFFNSLPAFAQGGMPTPV